MIITFGTPCWRNVRRRLISGVVLLAYCVAALGFPLPAAAMDVATSCGQRVCCCGSEAQCRASGCGCAHSPLPPHVETPAEATDASTCCTKPTSQAKQSDKKPGAAPMKAQGKSMRWVIAISAQKCGGGATEWINAQAALPGPLPHSWLPSWPFCHCLPILHEYHFILAMDRLDPPPR